MLLEVCFIQNKESKSVLAFQPFRTRNVVCGTAEKAKPIATCLIFHLRNKNRHQICSGEVLHNASPEKRVITTNYEAAKPSPLQQNISANHNHNQLHPSCNQKRGRKPFRLWHNRFELQLVATINQNFLSNLILYHFILQLRSIIFSVSNEGVQLSLGFGLDSVILTIKDLVPEMTMSNKNFSLPAYNLLLSRIQEFLDNHLVPIPTTLNHQGMHEMREEVLSTAGA